MAENSINIQARVDICTLATLARAYTDENVFIRSKSDLIWKAVEHLVAMYESKGVIKFTDVYEALNYLEKIGLQLGTSIRTKRQVASAQVNQNAIEDFGFENFGKRLSRTQIEKDERAERLEYEEASAIGKAAGLTPPTFEQFKENKRRQRAAMRDGVSSDVVVETLDPQKVAEKEANRLAQEKAAYSPDALRAAMASPPSSSAT